MVPPQSNFIRKATVCLLSFIPICGESEADGMVINMANSLYYIQKVTYTNRIMLLTVYGWQPLVMYCPDENTKYGRDDIGISTLFCDIFRNSILKCIEQNCWYTYDGTR